jgi:ribosome maturation factor RimP
MLGKKEQQLLAAIEPLAERNGVEIVTIDIVGAKKSPIIRVYIDTPDGVSFNELSSAQAWIGELLDEIDPFPGAYTLEVSSPGIDRPLRTQTHFEAAIGEQAKVKTATPIDGARNFKGVLTAANADGIDMTLDDGRIVHLGYADVARANVIGKVDF